MTCRIIEGSLRASEHASLHTCKNSSVVKRAEFWFVPLDAAKPVDERAEER